MIYSNKSAGCTPVENSNEAATWDADWYVVNSTLTLEQPITVSGTVNLILADGCTLAASQGSVVAVGNSLTIYAQSDGTGTLIATGRDSAGIGGAVGSDYGVDGGSSGAITIHGGNITATSGWSAGIGGGASQVDGKGGSGSNIIIYGGGMKAGSADIPSTFTRSNPDNRPAVQSRYATAWVFTPADNNTYAIVNGISDIQVVPASIAGTVVH